MEAGTDNRGLVIARMNEALRAKGHRCLTPRQEHLVREFVEDDGKVRRPEDERLLQSLLASNSA